MVIARLQQNFGVMLHLQSDPMTLRVLSWNCRRASADHRLWQYFAELSPDVAVLQEVTGVPCEISGTYDIRAATPPTRADGLQRFQSMILARGAIRKPVPLLSSIQWVDRELVRFAPNLLAFEVTVRDLPPLIIVGVYAPAWPVARSVSWGRN
jgi:hypothetical protein